MKSNIKMALQKDYGGSEIRQRIDEAQSVGQSNAFEEN